MRKLFVSFTSLLALVADNKVTAEDMAEGLYFFGCTRRHAFQPGAQGETDERTWNRGKNAVGYPVVREALRVAEGQRRVAWRHDANYQRVDPYTALNDLLTDNGLSPIERPRPGEWAASYPTIADAVAAKGIPLDVVY